MRVVQCRSTGRPIMVQCLCSEQ